MAADFSALAKAMEEVDDNGREGRCGDWRMALGGYDMGYEIYFMDEPLGRVNYESEEYELYDEGSISQDELPCFLKAIDATGFRRTA